MRGFVSDIERLCLENENFRKVLYTGSMSQLVLMSLKPGEDIGSEVHTLDQFLRCEIGTGKAIVGGVTKKIGTGFAVFVPAGVEHNIVNTSADLPLKLYTLYAPPNHQDGVVHRTKEQALGSKEHFDGTTTE